MSPALAAALRGRAFVKLDTLPAEVQAEASARLNARARARGYRCYPQPASRLLCGCPEGAPTAEAHGFEYCTRCSGEAPDQPGGAP